MSEEIQPVIVTIDDEQFDMNEQSDVAKEHFAEVINLRKEISQLQEQIALAGRRSVSLQVALGYRESALKESIQMVDGEADAADGSA